MCCVRVCVRVSCACECFVRVSDCAGVCVAYDCLCIVVFMCFF